MTEKDSSKPSELSPGVKAVVKASSERLKAQSEPTSEQLEQRRAGWLKRNARHKGLIAAPMISGNWRIMRGQTLIAEGLTLDEAEAVVQETRDDG